MLEDHILELVVGIPLGGTNQTRILLHRVAMVGKVLREALVAKAKHGFHDGRLHLSRTLLGSWSMVDLWV